MDAHTRQGNNEGPCRDNIGHASAHHTEQRRQRRTPDSTVGARILSRGRASWRAVRSLCRVIVCSKIFGNIIIAAIIMNTIVMALDKHDQVCAVSCVHVTMPVLCRVCPCVACLCMVCVRACESFACLCMVCAHLLIESSSPPLETGSL